MGHLLGIVCLMLIHFNPLEATSFPSVLPVENVDVYFQPVSKIFRIEGDIFSGTIPNTLKNLKTAGDSLYKRGNSDLSDEMTLFTRISQDVLTLLKQILAGLKQLTAKTPSGLELHNSIKLYPISQRLLDFEKDLTSLTSVIKISKRDTFQYKTFLSITNNGLLNLKSDVVGCRLDSPKPSKNLSCLKLYLRLVKKPRHLYVGSELLLKAVQFSRRRRHPWNTPDNLEVIRDLLDINFDPNMDLKMALRGYLKQRLLKGPSDEQIQYYSENNIPVTSEQIDLSAVDPDFDTDMTTAEEDDIIDYSQETDIETDKVSLLDLLDEEMSWLQEIENRIDPTPTPTPTPIPTPTPTPTPAPSVEQKVRIPSDIHMFMSDATTDTQTPEKSTEEPTTVSSTEKVTEKATETTKAVSAEAKIDQLTATVIDRNYRKITENFIRNMLDSLFNIRNELLELNKLINAPTMDLTLLEQYGIEIDNIHVTDMVYKPGNDYFDLIIEMYANRSNLLKFERVVLCGYTTCLTPDIPTLLADSLDFNMIFDLTACTTKELKNQLQYFCNKPIPEPDCLYIHQDCTYTLSSYQYKLYDLYLKSYLLVHSPMNGTLLQNTTLIPGHQISLITLKKDTTVTLDSKKITIKAIRQLLPTQIVPLFLNRLDVDLLGLGLLSTNQSSLIHRWLNSASVLGLSIILAILGITVTVKLCKTQNKTPIHRTTVKRQTLELSEILPLRTRASQSLNLTNN